MSDPRLHRIHAGPSAGKGGNSFNIGEVRWRGEGGSNDAKREMAYRAAVTWNVCEGWPTDALESGALREVDDAAYALLEELGEVDEHDAPALADAVRRLRDAFAQRDPLQDTTGGRLHDCESCLESEGASP